MKLWAQWCLDHHLKIVLYAVLVVAFPVNMITGAVRGMIEAAKLVAYEWRIVKEKP
jgi:hypothetical protein